MYKLLEETFPNKKNTMFQPLDINGFTYIYTDTYTNKCASVLTT